MITVQDLIEKHERDGVDFPINSGRLDLKARIILSNNTVAGVARKIGVSRPKMYLILDDPTCATCKQAAIITALVKFNAKERKEYFGI